MSVRNMMKVMMSLLMALLLAISLAATTADATRLDQSLTSAADDERVPYYVCAMFCPGSCTCDRAARPKSRCTCDLAGYSINSKKPAALLHTSAGTLQENSDLIPWTECHETCDSCACTKIWPPEANWCWCLDDTAPKKAAAVAIHKVPKVNGVLFPRQECDKNCNDACACPLIWPPPEYCSCADPKSSNAKCSENCEGVCVCDSPKKCSCSTDIKLTKKSDVVAVQQVPKVNAVLFPREECNKNCNSLCACILIWPPPRYCSCFDPNHSKTKCPENCEGVCVCDSPGKCSCSTDIKLSKKPKVKSLALMSSKKAVPKVKLGSFIPVGECEEKCNDKCYCFGVLPPPTTNCFCDKSPLPVLECLQKCDVLCSCPGIYPPPGYCLCEDVKPLAI